MLSFQLRQCVHVIAKRCSFMSGVIRSSVQFWILIPSEQHFQILSPVKMRCCDISDLQKQLTLGVFFTLQFLCGFFFFFCIL